MHIHLVYFFFSLHFVSSCSSFPLYLCFIHLQPLVAYIPLSIKFSSTIFLNLRLVVVVIIFFLLLNFFATVHSRVYVIFRYFFFRSHLQFYWLLFIILLFLLVFCSQLARNFFFLFYCLYIVYSVK